MPISNDPLTTFGARVRELRQAAGISQEELAHRAGMHRTYVGSVERGERNVAILSLRKIATALRVTPAELLTETRATTE